MEALTIRPANLTDIEEIRLLVAELARYEKAEAEFTCNPDEYITLYKEGLWNAIVACHEGAIIGVCIYYFGFSTWKGKFLYLEDFIVTDSKRRKGIGAALFDHLFNIAVEHSCALMRWQVLEWNQPAISFYEKYEVTFEDDWLNCRLSLSSK